MWHQWLVIIAQKMYVWTMDTMVQWAWQSVKTHGKVNNYNEMPPTLALASPMAVIW